MQKRGHLSLETEALRVDKEKQDQQKLKIPDFKSQA